MAPKIALKSRLIHLLPIAPLLLSLPLSAAAVSNLVYDDFDDNQINSHLWFAYQGEPGPVVSETNQRLEILYPPQSAGEVFGAGYVSICQLRGDFDIQVDYQLPVWPPANGVRVALVTVLGSVERTSFGNLPDFPGEPREVYLTNFGDNVAGITETTHLSGRLRQTRSGSTVSAYYFDEGNWVLIYSADATTNDTTFGLESWSHDYAFTDQVVNAAFDNALVADGDLVCPPIDVSIDIKPGDTPNAVQPSSRGKIPVAILTTDLFDAVSVQPSTVLFGPTGNEASPVHTAFEDVDNDGDVDLILHFLTQETQIQCGDTSAVLAGATTTERAVIGYDTVTTVGCK